VTNESDNQITSLESLATAAKKMASNPNMSAMWPHIYWWDLQHYLHLIDQGAIFYVKTTNRGGLKLAWNLPEGKPLKGTSDE